VIAPVLAFYLAASLFPAPQEDTALSADGSRVVLNEGHAFVELSTPKFVVLVDEPFRVFLRFGIEREFAAANLIQLFRKQLDVPVQIQADWLGGSGDLVLSGSGEPESEGLHRFALGAEILGARLLKDRQVDGKNFVVYEYSRLYKVAEPQALALGALQMRYAFATQFEESLFTGRSPRDRSDAVVQSDSLQIQITSLPLDNPPIGFSGAIGQFEVSASLELDEGDQRGIIKWTLRLEGEGNQHEIKAPSVADFSGLDQLGVLDAFAPQPGSPREFVYEFVRKPDSATSVPAYDFIYFDVESNDFKTLSTESLAIPNAVAAIADTEGEQAATSEQVGAVKRKIPSWLVLLSICLSVGVVLFFLLRKKADGAGLVGEQAAASKPDLQAALKDFEEEQSAGLLPAYSNYLGVCLSLPADELQAESLGRLLMDKGVASDLAERAAAVLQALLAAQYGRAESSVELQGAAAIVQELSASWA
jgi:hypothetical protein